MSRKARQTRRAEAGPRHVPTIALAYTDGSRKRFATKRQVYYRIAKELVLAKYPAGIGERIPDEHELARWKMTWETAAIRSEKALDLFFVHHGEWDNEAPGWEFSQEKWKRFLNRVAKYLSFVDARRPPVDDRPSSVIEKHATQIENALATLAAEHARLTRILEQRSNEAGHR